MKIVRPWLELLQAERGSSAVIVALMIVVLLSISAIVVELGMMYVERSRLVIGAEASALAGAASFPYRESGEYLEEDYQAMIDEAARIAAQNDLDDYEIRLLPEDEDPKNIVEVVAREEVDLFLARVMGFDLGRVSGLAAAKSVPISGFLGVLPLGIPEDEFEGFGVYELKVAAGSGEEGNYQPLALGGTGSNNYRDNLDNGYDEILRVEDIVDTETGNMSNPTKQGLEDRYESGDREIIIPIVTSPESGRSEVGILGFGVFYLENIDEDQATGHTIVEGTFRDKVSEGELSDSGVDYGLRGTRLIR